MKIYFFLIILFISVNATAQQFYFPKSFYADSNTLAKNIPTLAKQLIALYIDAQPTYYDNLFRYDIVAMEYKQSNSILDSVREIYKSQQPAIVKAIGFPFQTFSSAKILEKEKNISFENAYKQTFDSLYITLNDESSTVTSGLFNADLKDLRNKVYSVLNKHNGDSINLDDAKLLLRTYNSYNVYSQVIPLAKPIIAQLENKKYIIADSSLITMRDGNKVAAVIVRNRKLTTPQPVIMMSNIYYGSYELSQAKEIVRRGFSAVIINTRGKYISDVSIEPFEHDANDAYDAIDWISKQPWCNGKIGMYGGSYLGFSQWAAVKKLHAALKTIVPQVAVGAGIDYPMQGGVFMSYMLRWIHYVTNSKITDQDDFNNTKKWNNTFINWYKTGKSFRSLDTIEGRPNLIFQRWLQHPSYDYYWKSMTPQKEEFSKINIPILTITGYFDDDQRGAFYYYNQHLQYNKNADHYLLIGPWNHYGAQSHGYSTAGYKIDSAGNISIDDIVFQWFDYVLKGKSKPSILMDKVNYEVMGTNEWKHARALNITANNTLTFYLSNVSATNKYYQLQNNKPALKYIEQEVNFNDRSDSLYMNDVRNSDDYPILDSTINRRNYLSFISKPLEQPIEITGSFFGEIVTAINKKDVDINIQLYELQPDGKYFQLSSYITRASYTKDISKRQLLQRNKIEAIPINNSFFVSKKLGKGSKIIVLLGVNKNRDWQLNYGSGKDISDETTSDAKVPMQIKWFNNSVIKIPVYK